MPYCSKCRYEFQDWVKVCSNCSVDLVDELPALPERETYQGSLDQGSLVHIATASNEVVANMWSGILKEHGIRCLLKGGGLQATGYASPLTVNWEIHVLESRAEEASEVLAPFLEDQHVAEP